MTEGFYVNYRRIVTSLYQNNGCDLNPGEIIIVQEDYILVNFMIADTVSWLALYRCRSEITEIQKLANLDNVCNMVVLVQLSFSMPFRGTNKKYM